MLNIMGNFQPDKDGPKSVVELHKKSEAMKLAYVDLYVITPIPFRQSPGHGPAR
jgi:gamma-glutamyltranspeptidase